MSSLVRRLVGALAVLLLLGAIALLGNGIFRGERRGPAGTAGEPGSEGLGAEYRTITLYFADPEAAGLAPERRELRVQGERGAMVEATVQALAGGPLTRLLPTLPAGTRIHSVFVEPQGTVYVDFSGELSRGMQGAGLTQEVLLLQSLARTLRTNYSGLRALQVLVDGRPVSELGGHFDVSRPLLLTDWE